MIILCAELASTLGHARPMKNPYPLLLGVLLAGCATTNSEKHASAERSFLEAPSMVMSERTGVPIKDLHTGFSVFVFRCAACHEYMYPDDLSKKDWHKVVPGMAANAGISKIEEEALLKYLIASKSNAKNTSGENR